MADAADPPPAAPHGAPVHSPDPVAAGGAGDAPAPVEIRPADPWGLALRIVLVAIAAGIALWLAVTLRGILIHVLVAIILATGLNPLVARLHRAGLPRGAAVLLIYLGLIAALVLLGVAVIPPIVREADEMVRNAPQYGERLAGQLRALQEQLPFLPPLDDQLLAQLRGVGAQLGMLAGQAVVVARFVLGLFGGLVATVLILLITLYLIVDGERVRDYFLSFFRPERHARLRLVTDRMGARMSGWLLGQVALSGAIGLTSFVGLTAIGVPGAMILAVIAAIGEAIPLVGPVIAAVPAVIVAATVSPTTAILTLVLYVVLQQLENNLLVPKIMEQAVKLHPLAVVLSLIVGGELMGIGGAIVAVPVAAAIAVVLDELRHAPLDEPGTAVRQ